MTMILVKQPRSRKHARFSKLSREEARLKYQHTPSHCMFLFLFRSLRFYLVWIMAWFHSNMHALEREAALKESAYKTYIYIQ